MATSLQRPMRADERRRVPDTEITPPARPKPTVAAAFAGQQPVYTPLAKRTTPSSTHWINSSRIGTT